MNLVSLHFFTEFECIFFRMLCTWIEWILPEDNNFVRLFLQFLALHNNSNKSIKYDIIVLLSQYLILDYVIYT